MALSDEVKRSAELQDQSRVAAANFLSTELDTALTFAKAALTAGDNVAKRERNRANARKAYDTLLRFQKKFKTPVSLIADCSGRFDQLKVALRQLGESDL